MNADAFMTTNPITIDPDRPVREAAQLMEEHDIGDVVVTNASKPIGIITDRDIAIRVVAPGRSIEQTAVRGAMTANPVTARADEPIATVIERMVSSQVRRLIVVGADGKLVGVISTGDLAQNWDSADTPGKILAAVTRPE